MEAIDGLRRQPVDDSTLAPIARSCRDACERLLAERRMSWTPTCRQTGLSHGFTHQVFFAKRHSLGRKRLRITLLLPASDVFEHVPENLVLGTRSLTHTAVLLEGACGQGDTFELDLDLTILGLADEHALARGCARELARLKQVEHALVVQREVMRHASFFLPTEQPLELLVREQRTMCIVRASRRTREATDVVLDELERESVRIVHRRNGAQPQLLHEPILQRLVRTFDRPLAGALFAQITSMFSSNIARPNCV